MGNKNGKMIKKSQYIIDSLDQSMSRPQDRPRETMMTWYRKNVAVTDVYDIVDTIGQGHMGEVFKVARKVEAGGLHNAITRQRSSNLGADDDRSRTRSKSPFKQNSKKNRKRNGEIQKKLCELNNNHSITRDDSRKPPIAPAIKNPKPILRAPSWGNLQSLDPEEDVSTQSNSEPIIESDTCDECGKEITLNETIDSITKVNGGNQKDMVSTESKDGQKDSISEESKDGQKDSIFEESKENLPITPTKPTHDRNCHVRFQRFYACKTVRIQQVKGHLDELLNECNVMSKLDHPYIIRLFQVYQHQTNLWLICELCTGGDLTSRKLSEPKVTLVMEQILSGLVYLHRNNVLHRDLKLENVLYKHSGADSEIRLIDFGLSRTYDILDKKRREILGAAYSMSPEIAGDTGPYTAKSDVWSIGIMAWILLAGDYPFLRDPSDQENKDKMDKLINANYHFGITWRGRGISNHAKKFVAGCLKKNPDERWSAMDALGYVQNEWIPQLEEQVRKEKLEQELQEAAQIANITKKQSKKTKNIDAVKIDAFLNQSLASKRRNNTEMLGVVGVKIEDVERYITYGPLKKTIFITMANYIERRDVEHLQKVFLAEDTENTGTITFMELKRALTNLDAKFVDNERQQLKIFEGIDHDKSGHIHFAEFVAALAENQGLVTLDRLKDAFDRIDSSGKGFIDHDDLKSILGKDYRKEVVDEMMEEGNFESKNKISFEEFQKLMLNDSRS